ncbi:phosphatase PAP2 family protein [Ideonella azotifigens]|uniref:Phosphatidic acid phosphatase type 2/haloperoxidase domain-containing protein n=1 Tax=Ideonella azotifigens TaxID=513160 RepID=A0ABN1KBZ2_9BURK|nr:phosphatase PAP2 family protein [Ideonella azotifigens]MCD2343043.1 phosphatase PAP2 family protein [Ideonella azotifigens]
MPSSPDPNVAGESPLRSSQTPWWSLGIAFLLILAGTALQLRPELNHALFRLGNQAAGGPDAWTAGIWAGLSVAGLGLSTLMVVMALDRTRQAALAAALWCIPVAALLTHLPKNLVRSPRPPKLWTADQLWVIGEPIVHSPSMPSGHSLTAFAMATLLASAMGWARWQQVAVFGVAALVALSRVAVGAHWPSDVLAGAGLGLLSGLIALALAQRSPLQRWLNLPRGRRLLAVLELLLALAMLVQKTGYPIAQPLQWTLALMSLCSAVSRWQSADAPAGADARVARLVLPCLLAGLALAVLLRNASWQPVAEALRGLPAWAWLALCAGLWGSYALRAERLRREWGNWGRANRPGQPMLTLHDSVDLFLAHNAALLVLPMRAGEAGYPWLLNRRFGIPVADALRSLVWLRLQDACVLGLLGLACLLPGSPWLRLGAVAGALLVLLVLLPRLSNWLGAKLPRWRALQAGLLAHRDDRLGWLLCLANWCLKLLVLGGGLALLAPLPWLAGVSAAVAGELAVALPIQAPAGVGSYEAAIWAAGQWLQVAAEPARLTSAALAVHALSLAVALLSFALYRGVAMLLPRRTSFKTDFAADAANVTASQRSADRPLP